MDGRRHEVGGLPRRHGPRHAVDDANENPDDGCRRSGNRLPPAPTRTDERDENGRGIGPQGLAQPRWRLETVDLERLRDRIIRIDCRIQSNGFRLEGLMGSGDRRGTRRKVRAGVLRKRNGLPGPGIAAICQALTRHSPAVVVCHHVNIPRLEGERAKVRRALFSHSDRRKKTQLSYGRGGRKQRIAVERLASVMTRGIKPST